MQKKTTSSPKVIVKKKRRVVIPQQGTITKSVISKVNITPAKTEENKPERKRPLNKSKSVSQVLKVLSESLPDIFGTEPKPLKIGFSKELVASDIKEKLSPRECGKGITSWVNSTKYLESCIAGAPRFDIDGNPSGEVTEKQAKYAKAQLAVAKLVQSKEYSRLSKSKKYALRRKARKEAEAE